MEGAQPIQKFALNIGKKKKTIKNKNIKYFFLQFLKNYLSKEARKKHTSIII